MFQSLESQLSFLALFVCCGLALWKGGPPERLGTAMLAVSWIGADVARGFSNQMVPTVTILASDVLLAAGFLYVAIRYSSLWLGAAMILQAFAFALHAVQLSSTEEGPRWHGFILYLLLDNARSYAVLRAYVEATLGSLEEMYADGQTVPREVDIEMGEDFA